MQNTAHPRSYVSALSGGESIGGDGITEKLTTQRRLEKLTKES